jgi:hypothetical protein
MGRASIGSNTLVALGDERSGQWGVPAGTLLQYGASLPLTARMTGSEGDSGQTNPRGFRRRRIPGEKGGAFEWGHPLTVGHLLPFFLHLVGAGTKETLEAGVFKYVFTPPGIANHANTSFWAIAAAPPHLRWLLYGIMLGELTMEVGESGGVTVRFAGEAGHGSKWGLPIEAEANTGTYVLGPWMRGVAIDPTLPVWMRIHALWAGATPPKVKILQQADEPSGGQWAAATNIYTAVIDPESDQAVWQNAQSSLSGLDLGLWTENKDPLEWILPGTQAQHSTLAVGDVYQFDPPKVWENPALVELTGHTRMTTAHWVTRFREEGDSEWLTRGGFTGTVSLEQAVKAARGNSSRYATDMYRIGEFGATVELSRDLLDSLFDDAAERHARIEMEHVFEGPQLGSGLYRESLLMAYPALAIDEHEAEPSDEDAVEENVTLSAETNDDGDEPVVITAITSRDWSHAALTLLDT